MNAVPTAEPIRSSCNAACFAKLPLTNSRVAGHNVACEDSTRELVTARKRVVGTHQRMRRGLEGERRAWCILGEFR